MELPDLELVSRKVERSEHLIAKFVDGYAAGWEFAVPDVFKECLDIKKTTKTIDKKTFQIVTQGIVYNFGEGNTFYNNKLAYDNWLEFLKGKNPIAIQVEFCSSSGYKTKNTKTTITSPIEIKDNSKNKTVKSLKIQEQSIDKGYIKIQIYKPNKEKNKILKDRILEMTVFDFVSLLQNGKFYDKDLKQYISYKYEG